MVASDSAAVLPAALYEATKPVRPRLDRRQWWSYAGAHGAAHVAVHTQSAIGFVLQAALEDQHHAEAARTRRQSPRWHVARVPARAERLRRTTQSNGASDLLKKEGQWLQPTSSGEAEADSGEAHNSRPRSIQRSTPLHFWTARTASTRSRRKHDTST